MAGMTQREFPFLDAAHHVSQSTSKGVSVKVRHGTGLVIAVVRHDQLSEEALEAIARFRLAQYVAAGLYDAQHAWRYQKRGDPALKALSGHDMHVAVGHTNGRFLAYLCIQSALPLIDTSHASGIKNPNPSPRLCEQERPLFPVETEYGGIYNLHPGLRVMPVSGVRELSRLVRNQDPALRRDPIVQLALAEVLLAGARTLYHRAWRIEAVVGCIAPDARRVLYAMGMPIAYAPGAPVIGENLGGGAPELPNELLWAQAAHVPGRFWPCAIASADLRLDHDYFDSLDQVLESGDKITALRAVARNRLGAPRRRARYIASEEQAGGLFWTDRPLDPVAYGTSASAELDSAASA